MGGDQDDVLKGDSGADRLLGGSGSDIWTAVPMTTDWTAGDEGTSTIVRGNTDDDAQFEFELMIKDGSFVGATDYNPFDFIL